jgi:SAM-dependent methyltransferase
VPSSFIYSTEDLLGLLDEVVVGDDGARWNAFFADRSRPVPFFVEWPDESLAGWLSDGRLVPGRVLELGCGHGRNALYLARQGAAVDAVDLSAEALGWARQRAEAAGAAVTFQHCSIFAAKFEPESYDLVYDSGCLHHLPPHRRQSYVALVNRALKPGGHFGLTCFRPEGGSGFTDREVYERGSLGGGLGYTEEQLRGIWDRAPFTVRELRQMRKTGDAGPVFGADFLWVLLAAKDHQ